MITEQQINDLIDAFCNDVDSGCPSCSKDAMESFLKVFPTYREIAEKAYRAYWSLDE